METLPKVTFHGIGQEKADTRTAPRWVAHWEVTRGDTRFGVVDVLPLNIKNHTKAEAEKHARLNPPAFVVQAMGKPLPKPRAKRARKQ
jgi:hypothetical protein